MAARRRRRSPRGKGAAPAAVAAAADAVGGDDAGAAKPSVAARAATAARDEAWANPHRATGFAAFLVVYFAATALMRLQLRGVAGLYDMAWACNTGLLLCALGLVLRSRVLIGGAVFAVGMHHLLWVIDVASYLAIGSFPTGAAAYVAWEGTPTIELVSTLHHVWFLPMTFWVLRGNGGLPWSSIFAGSTFLTALAVLSQGIPKEVVLDSGVPFYLNVNLSHEWWRDAGVLDFMRVADGSSGPVYFTFLGLIGNQINVPAFVLLRSVSHAVC